MDARATTAARSRHGLATATGRAKLAVTTVIATVCAVVASSAVGAGSAAGAPIAAGSDAGGWVTAWSASMQGTTASVMQGIETLAGTNQVKALQKLAPPPATFADQTLRQVMYLHHEGSAVRVQLSNKFGSGPVTFPATTIGKRIGNADDVDPATLEPVTFNGGSRSVTIAPGGNVLSDPVTLPVNAFDSAVLSLFVPKGTPAATVHGNAMQQFYTAPGDRTTSASGTGFVTHGVVLPVPAVPGLPVSLPNIPGPLAATATTAVYWASGIQVRPSTFARTVVAFGDSITDGFLSTGNTNHRYPDYLARRLGASSTLSVANEAISGGRVTGDGIGPSALNRFDEEALQQPNVSGIIFLQGINDLGTAILQGAPQDATTLENAYKELAGRAHAAGKQFYIGTLTPSGDVLRPPPYGLYGSPQSNATRAAINSWLRGPGRQYFDGVIDFDQVIKDPAHPNWIAAKYDAGDNLHPNDAGYEAMAASIPQAYLDKLANG